MLVQVYIYMRDPLHIRLLYAQLLVYSTYWAHLSQLQVYSKAGTLCLS